MHQESSKPTLDSHPCQLILPCLDTLWEKNIQISSWWCGLDVFLQYVSFPHLNHSFEQVFVHATKHVVVHNFMFTVKLGVCNSFWVFLPAVFFSLLTCFRTAQILGFSWKRVSGNALVKRKLRLLAAKRICRCLRVSFVTPTDLAFRLFWIQVFCTCTRIFYFEQWLFCRNIIKGTFTRKALAP